MNIKALGLLQHSTQKQDCIWAFVVTQTDKQWDSAQNLSVPSLSSVFSALDLKGKLKEG